VQKLNESIYNPNSLSDIRCISFIIKHAACATKCPSITATCCHHYRVIGSLDFRADISSFAKVLTYHFFIRGIRVALRIRCLNAQRDTVGNDSEKNKIIKGLKYN